jgi:hypothetical protein
MAAPFPSAGRIVIPPVSCKSERLFVGSFARAAEFGHYPEVMLTFGDLTKSKDRLGEIGKDHVLIAANAGTEVVVRKSRAQADTTMVFQHETISMMRAERAGEVEKLKQQLTPKAAVIPIRKKAQSFWDQVTVGRASTADIVFDDPATSNVHAHFELNVDDHPVSVRDLGSSNGTFVNRQPLQPHRLTQLQSGDCVRFGQVVFYYVSNDVLRQLLGA